jgi:hypothetical protein
VEINEIKMRNIRNEKNDITTDFTHIKNNNKKSYKQLYANKVEKSAQRLENFMQKAS